MRETTQAAAQRSVGAEIEAGTGRTDLLRAELVRPGEKLDGAASSAVTVWAQGDAVDLEPRLDRRLVGDHREVAQLAKASVRRAAWIGLGLVLAVILPLLYLAWQSQKIQAQSQQQLTQTLGIRRAQLLGALYATTCTDPADPGTCRPSMPARARQEAALAFVALEHDREGLANLSDASLSATDLRAANLQNVDFSFADFRAASLDNADFSYSSLRGADLREAVLRQAILRRTDLFAADFSGATLRGADLREGNLEEVNLVDVDLREADFVATDLRGAALTRTDLRGANLRDAILSDMTLQSTVLSWAILRGARLDGANLEGVELTRADLREAHLRGADLTGADLSGATLRGADLDRASLSQADLRDAILVGAKNLTQAQLDAARGNAGTRLPADLTRPASW